MVVEAFCFAAETLFCQCRWPLINYDFRPAASHIRRGPGEVDRLTTRIGPQTQCEQIGQTEGSLDVQQIIGFKSNAEGESRRREAL